MGTLALDIETASPFEPPPSDGFDDTRYFELVAVGLGYRSDPDAAVETAVLFRRGGWDADHTADLLGRVLAWCADRDASQLVTYNGNGFDRVHLQTWATELDSTPLGSTDAFDPTAVGGRDVETVAEDGFTSAVEALFDTHVDLAPLAGERYSDRLPGRARFPAFERACEWSGVDVPETRYADYDLSEDFLRGHGVRATTVQGKHVGRSLGAAFVEGVEAGLEELLTFRELRRLLADYTAADVAPLFELADHLGATGPGGRTGQPR